MKKVILFAFILASFTAKAQDTTVVTNVTMKVRTMLMIVPFMQSYDDSVKVNIYFKWRKALKASNPTIVNVVNGNATVITDTMQTTLVADMYKYLTSQGNNAVTAAVTEFKTAISTQRSANAYLDRLCTQIETDNTSFYRQLLLAGRKLLIQL